MVLFKILTSNYILNVTATAWLTAQVLKTIIDFAFTKKLKAERMIGAGGMPSAHSAFVCSLVMATAKQCGYSSPEFAISLVIATVVMYDAMGVRRAAGEQAKVLNKISRELSKGNNEDIIAAKRLKELLGHTPLEVLGGALVGIAVSMLF